MKLLLAYSFWKMFFNDQNLKHIYMMYIFLNLSSSKYLLTLVDIYSLEFISYYIKEILK